MRRSLFILIIAALGFGSAYAQVSTDYYLPENTRYNQNVPTPQDILNFQVGEWHVRPDMLVKYMYALAESSDRVTIETHHRTHENREGILLTITSAGNQSRINQIKADHAKLADASISDDVDVTTMPAVVFMGYGVHGNESSASNASLMVAYYLAAAQGPEIDAILNNTVILLDPSLNPDGMGRFAHWANMHKNTTTLTTDPRDREYSEAWPGGRTNHYWFDLNRDWLLVQHPESRGRVAKFHEWKPNVLTDYHEMGTNSTYFFQPGIPSRTHPLTPQANQTLTAAIAEYHAEELDGIQSLYYSQESFDDFYYGKGSTYPDINGAVGILFEQASSRGHAQESVHGVVTFPFTIRNQVKTSLSTFKATVDLREDLLNYMRQFYKDAAREARSSPIKAYVFGDANDKSRTNSLAEILKRHQVNAYALTESITSGGKTFEAGAAYIVPTNQPQFKLLTSAFERRTTFTDSLFYDVSSWTLPYAFNLPFAELSSREFNNDLLGAEYQIGDEVSGELIGGRSNYAYAFEWDEYLAPKAAYRLLSKGARLKVASIPFTAATPEGTKEFDYGTIIVPLGVQDNQDQVHDIINEIAGNDGINVYAISSGLTPSGIDLGSNNFNNLRKPEIAIIGGSGTSQYEIGEAWHLLDTRYNIPVTIIDKPQMSFANLDRYNVIVMANGGYGDFSEGTVNRIKDWVRGGGVLLTYKSAVRWAKQQGLAKVDFTSRSGGGSDEDRIPYVRQSPDAGANVIGGAIFNAKMDLTHPMAYGYNSEDLTVFRNSTMFMKLGNNPYSTPVVYTDNPLASGYSSDANVEALKNTASVVISRYGGGRVIAMADNPNFRAFWYGTNKLFANAIFFGHTIRAQTTN